MMEHERLYNFEMVGISPLIMHWDNIEWADLIDARRTELKEQDKKNFKAGDDRTPPETWKGYVYNDGNVVVIPQDSLRSSLLKAGAKITLSGNTSYKELSQSAVVFADMYYPLLVNGKELAWKAIDGIQGTFCEHCAAVRKLGFELFTKRAAVGAKKHVRVRAMFRDWKLCGSLLVTNEQVTEDVLVRMASIMGIRIGLGDWRPGAPKSPGPYGRSTVTVKAV
jgi:hypothetical protein